MYIYFLQNVYNLGCAKNAVHAIDTENHKEFRIKPFKRSKAEEEIVYNEIQQLLDKEMVILSKSPWALPMMLIKKKDETN